MSSNYGLDRKESDDFRHLRRVISKSWTAKFAVIGWRLEFLERHHLSPKTLIWLIPAKRSAGPECYCRIGVFRSERKEDCPSRQARRLELGGGNRGPTRRNPRRKAVQLEIQQRRVPRAQTRDAVERRC